MVLGSYACNMLELCAKEERGRKAAKGQRLFDPRSHGSSAALSANPRVMVIRGLTCYARAVTTITYPMTVRLKNSTPFIHIELTVDAEGK